MKIDGFLIKSDKDIELIANGQDGMISVANLKHGRSALDFGWIGAERKDLVSGSGNSGCE
jgi:hypothetical protein